ncbi:MAG: thiamine pyrophosphate-dependent enzyme [Actinomycetota bacterium]|nr:thiamine pyrophosphate-dependent enzyme [Actinomycetota bacterium]
MNRLEALERIESVTREWALVVTCGATAREMATVSRSERHLPLLDSMGLTCAVGLGVALGTTSHVGVVDGDGSLLMGFSILPTLATTRPANLTVVVLDNQQHASADGMASQAAQLDLAVACAGFGFAVDEVADGPALGRALERAVEARELRLVLARIEPGNAEGVPLLLEDPAVLASRFAAALEAPS